MPTPANTLIDAVRLLAAMTGFVAVPNLRNALSIHDAANKVAARPPPSLRTLADELAERAETTFAGFRDAPADAAILYEQMVARGLLTPRQIVAAGMDPSACTAAMLARLTDPVHTAGEMPGLFAAITEPTLTALFATREYAADLTPAYMADILQTAHRLEGKIDNVAARLDNLEAQTRDTLDALALRFGEPAPEAMTLPDLRAFLIEKARDYRALREEVEALRGTTPRIDNILSAVEAAIASLDLAEADTLLSSVRETTAEALRKPLEDNARVMEAQARVALLRNDPETACTLLAAAADSFAALDPIAPARRRLDAGVVLDDHGRRYGGRATDLAETMVRAALAALSPDAPDLWAEANNTLGTILIELGVRTGGGEGDRLLSEAVAAFEVSQSIRRGSDPKVTDNLAVAYLSQAQRVGGEERADLVRRSIAGSRAAIPGFGDDRHAVAKAQNNLGNALQLLAGCVEAPERIELLHQAFQAFDIATRTFGELGDTPNMAGARFGVAMTWSLTADATSDPALRARAIDELRQAVVYYGKADVPQDRAMAAMNLGVALMTQSTVVAPAHVPPLLAEAEQMLQTAAGHYAATRQSRAHVIAESRLALALELRAATGPDADRRPALEAADAALGRAVLALGGDPSADPEQGLGPALQRVRGKLAALV